MMEYVGYHGTSNDAAEKIIEQHKFMPSDKGWLGSGTYFFPYADDAKWWCEENKKLSKGQYKILKVRLVTDKVLDLLSSGNTIKKFRKICDKVKNKCMGLRFSYCQQVEYFMTLAINAFLKISKDVFNENFDVIIAGFDQNRKDWYFVNRYAEEKKKFPIIVAQIQYCVRNSKCIIEITNHEEVI